ncbi:MAG: hypothetical protein JWM59_1071 [Verrucomicrobiales bacterium]|nr:hypothetical protein [Verrucomicrobiales bacterium]
MPPSCWAGTGVQAAELPPAYIKPTNPIKQNHENPPEAEADADTARSAYPWRRASQIRPAAGQPARSRAASAVKAANGGRADEVKIIHSSGDSGKIYVVEIGLGDNRDLDLRVAANGEILKSIEKVALSSTPEAIRTALEKLAGTTARIEDVKKMTKGQEVTWQAELDRKDARTPKSV